ncbi:Strigolactone esterase D14, partial [Mucuna pruriens]
LAENYNLVLFDWPFSEKRVYEHGKYTSYEPYADDLITIMNEMDLKSVTFVGHSMSAMIFCIASTKQPHLFKRLVLGNYFPNNIIALHACIIAYAPIAVDPNDAVSVEKFKNCLKNMGVEVAISLAKTVFFSDYRDMLEMVQIPCTIIQSSNDVAVLLNIGNYLKEKIKGVSSLEIIDMTAHFPQLTAHLKLVELLKAVVVSGPAQI